MAVENDIEVYKNEDITLPFVNEQKPITGWTIVFTLRTRAGATGTPILTIDAIIDNASLGTYHIPLTSLQLTRLAKDYYYDIQRTNVGSVAVLSIGNFTIKQEVRIP